MNMFLPIFGELMLKSAAVVTIAAGVNACWRSASAASRHLIWTLGFATLLALPLSRMAAPVWTVELTRPHTFPLPPAPEPVALAAASFAGPARPGATPSRSFWRQPDWSALLALAWLGGVGAILVCRLSGQLRWNRLRRQSQPLGDARVQALARSIAAECGLAGKVDVRSAACCPVPLVWGVWRPVVVLPETALRWPEQRLADALRHEFGHVRRGDCPVQWGCQAACALYWMNPLVWLAARRLRVAQEQACDDIALAGGAKAADYAGWLVQTVRGLQSSRRLTARQALAMAQPSTLEARVRAIVDPGRNRAPLRRGAVFLGGTAAAALLAGSALAQVANEPGATGRPILVEARFVEVNDAALQQASLEWLRTASNRVISGQPLAPLWEALGKTGGVDILATPRVTTLPKQRATIQIARDFVYAIEWDKGDQPGTWTPKRFETKNVGITLKVQTFVHTDGRLELEIEPELVNFLGFTDLDAGEKAAGTLTAKLPPGHRSQPVFSTRRIKSRVLLQSGQTVVLGGFTPEKQQRLILEAGPFGTGETKAEEKRHLFVLVTAKLTDAAGAEHAVSITSDALTYDKAAGAVAATGNVRIETPQAVIQADKAVIRPKPAPAAAEQEGAAARPRRS